MKLSKIALSLVFIAATSITLAQKIVKVEGDLSFLASAPSINIEYEYSEMGVGKFKTEEEYVNKKVEEYNADEAGRGDKWKESWIGSRERVYHPKFEELFNKYAEKAGVSGARNQTNAKYTLIVKTTFTEPGFNIGITSKPASVNFEYIFVETGTDKVIAKFVQQKVPGAQAMGMDFDTSTRISESYAKAGKMFGAYISKNLK